MGEFRQTNRGAEVCEEAEMFTEWEEGGALGLLGGGQGFPFRAADGAEQNGIRLLACGEGFGGKSLADGIDGGTAHRLVIEFQAEGEFFLHRCEDLETLSHDFGADAVAGKNGDAECLVVAHWRVLKRGLVGEARSASGLAGGWGLWLDGPVNMISTRVAALVLPLLLVACASVSVEKIHHSVGPESGPRRAPDEILIQPFDVPVAALRVDRQGGDLEDFRRNLQATLGRQLVQRLKKHVAPARIVAAGDALPQGNFWLVSGTFERVNQGSRLLRSTVGLGTGGTKMEATAKIFDLSGPEPVEFLQIETTGGSNISQGIGGVVMFPFSGPMALTSLFNAVDGVRSGVSFDAQRTAKEIAATLSEYLHKRRALRGKEPLQPKRLGEMPDMIPD
jgi:hypothetical protein